MQQNDSAREKSGMGWDRLGLLQRAVAWYNYIKIINLARCAMRKVFFN